MEKDEILAGDIITRMIGMKDHAQSEHLKRFFKTGPGEYGEGDRFLGIRVPQTRAIVKDVKGRVKLEQIGLLLESEWHEIRLAGLLLLVAEMKRNLPGKTDTVEKRIRRGEIARFYLDNTAAVNNWDLVDLSTEYIIGPYLRHISPFDHSLLLKLAESNNLWEQRISIVTTLDFIRAGIFNPTLELADKLIDHPHDLIHKAIGWTLREIGKRDREMLVAYLEMNYSKLPRTALRYAIEHFDERERKAWLRKK